LADQVVVCSESLRNYAIEAEGASSHKVCVIPHGVQVEEAGPVVNRGTLHSEFNIPAESKLIGSLGRLSYQKGYDVLMKALARMSDKTVHVVIAGTGELLPSLQAQAKQLGIIERVHFAGFRQDVSPILYGIDIYVQPSRFEGMPNAVLEAMAAECPIIASNVDGNKELIENGVTGWLVPPEDDQGLAEALASALVNPTEAKWRGRLAKKLVLTNYKSDKMISAWDEILSGYSNSDT